MELHNKARSCPASRVLLVRRILGGLPVTGAASASRHLEANGVEVDAALNNRTPAQRLSEQPVEN